MNWTELTIQTAPQGVELLCDALTNAGFDSFAVDDGAQFAAFLQTAQDYWDYVDESLGEKMAGLSQVRLWLGEDADKALSRLQALLAALPARYPSVDFGALTLRLENIPDEDWENSWKKNYRPLDIGKTLRIIPKWMAPDVPEGRKPLLLDLGLTFGTGEHDSTRLCLELLERVIRGGERVADLGSGSGILSIAALLLGAQSAVGVDVDPAAERIARENAALNGFDASRFTAQTANVIDDTEAMRRLSEGGYDVVCANIVAGVLVRLAPVLPHFLREDGLLVCSGILLEREQEVREAFARAGLCVLEAPRTQLWCALLARRGGGQ